MLLPEGMLLFIGLTALQLVAFQWNPAGGWCLSGRQRLTMLVTLDSGQSTALYTKVHKKPERVLSNAYR